MVRHVVWLWYGPSRPACAIRYDTGFVTKESIAKYLNWIAFYLIYIQIQKFFCFIRSKVFPYSNAIHRQSYKNWAIALTFCTHFDIWHSYVHQHRNTHSHNTCPHIFFSQNFVCSYTGNDKYLLHIHTSFYACHFAHLNFTNNNKNSQAKPWFAFYEYS